EEHPKCCQEKDSKDEEKLVHLKMVVKEIVNRLLEEVENLEWWFKQDIDDEEEEDEEGKGGSEV
ncbi:hypothetical protein Tco_0676554, partial [Tanacetum coccineum]